MALTTLFFDLDDTLINDSEATYDALLAACQLAEDRYAIPSTTFHETIRNTAQQLWRTSTTFNYCQAMGISSLEGLCAGFTAPDPATQELRRWTPHYRLQAWSQALAQHNINDPSLASALSTAFIEQRLHTQITYPEVAEVLATLHTRYRLGLITNGTSDFQRIKLQKSLLADAFDTIIVSGEIEQGKPNPAVFLLALNRLQAQPAQAVMIGDRLSRDIVGAQNVGMKGILVNRLGEPADPSTTTIPDGELTDFLPLQALLTTLCAEA
jgi:putative hydrolase of the HAD superfamily